MCTVTFIPVKEKYFITSNRDEKNSRKQAIPPEIYIENGSRIICPRDADAGGTWIAVNENGNAAVLLNGGFERHKPAPPYRKSRGIIFMEILSAELPVRCFSQLDLKDIEPFTMIIFEQCLYECRWTGSSRHCRQLKKQQPYIWSSSTLYDETVVKKREQWFSGFLVNHPQPGISDILDFHRFTGDGDDCNDLKMNRDGILSTVSITSIALEYRHCSVKYLDLVDNRTYCKEMKLFTPMHEADIF